MNKNKRNIAYILLTIVALSSFSCTKDFTKINVDPLGKTEVAPDKILAPTLVNLMRTNMLRNRNFNNELMQVTVNPNDGEGRVFRYDIRRTEADNTWNNWYVNLTDIKDIYTVAQKPEYANKSYQAISLIVQAWVYQLLTDTYGDVPYSEANNGKESLQPTPDREKFIQPKFDKQKDIYLDLFDKLEEANNLLKDGVAITSESDPVYHGEVAKWRKLGNSLYLRLLMRVAHKSDISAQAIAKIKEIIDINPANYPVMVNNHFSGISAGTRKINDSDNAVILWGGTNSASAVYTSPFMSNVRANDFRLIGICDFFMNNLNAWKHPCVLNMGSPSYTNRWSIDGTEGIPSGYVPGEVDRIEAHFNSDQDTDGTGSNPRKKSYNLQIDSYTGIIMNVAELDFIKAEAALEGWIAGDPESFYNQGIVNATNYWRPNYYSGVSDAKLNTYLTDAGIKLDVGLPKHSPLSTVKSKMNLIHLQKYYALFLVDFQQWFEYRRTGYPILPRGNGLEGREMPARLNYPTIVQSTNPVNYKNAVASQGADDVNTKVWWQKP